MRIFVLCQCTDYARVSYTCMWVQVRRAWHVLRLLQARRSCLVFVVSKLQWPRCAIIPDLHRQRTPSIVHDLFESSVSEYVRLCDAHMAYICLSYMYVTTFRVTFLNKTHHIRMHVRTYVLCENRSSIQSFALMRLPIIHSHTATVVQHTTCILQDLYR